MLKNLLLKRFLKHRVFPLVSLINRIVPKNKKMIFLYTANKGVQFCNLTVRNYLLEHGYDKKYKIYCGIERMKYAEDLPRVKFVSGIRSVLVFLRSAHVFYTVGQLPIKPTKNQMVIFMQHGNADFKRMGKNMRVKNGCESYFTYLISPSEFYVKPHMAAYECRESDIIIAGDPMCDDMLKAPRDKYNFSNYSKLLVWFPTYRQSDYLGSDDSSIDSLIPLFKEEDYGLLNEHLAKHNICLIVKLHPVQTAPIGAQRHMSHLNVYSHDEFNESECDTYTLMAQSDGMIGDYSSMSMQYLMLDKPLAFVVPDIEEYGRIRGFVFDNPEDYMGGHIIKEKEEFWKFLDDFANNRDIYKEKRHWIYSQIYKYHDANSTERIVKLSGLKLD